MTRPTRFLLTSNSSSSSTSPPAVQSAVAEPPSTVAAESDFVVILAALLCAAICVSGLIAVARCTCLQRGTTANTPSPANKGLKKKVLKSLPMYKYDKSTTTTTTGAPAVTAECAICLVEYAEGDEIRVLPNCGHNFHVQCVDTWLGSNSSCPSCRQLILVVARCRNCGETSGGSIVGGHTSDPPPCAVSSGTN